MLELTTPTGTITAPTAIELASRWASLEHGVSWDKSCGPFFEHTTVWEYIDALELLRDGELPGYQLTETTDDAR